MKIRHLAPMIALFAVAVSSAHAASIKGSLTGTKTRTSSSSAPVTTPIAYNVTINTAKTGELDSVVITESGASTYSDVYSYSSWATPPATMENPDPAEVPGTMTVTESSASSYKRTSTYYFGSKSFGGKVAESSSGTGWSERYYFTPDDTTIAPFVSANYAGSPSTYVEAWTNGGLANVKSKKGKITIKLSEPSNYSSTSGSSSSTSTYTDTTTIEVKPGAKPKMTIDVVTTSYSKSSGSPTPSTSSTVIKASGKAKGKLDAKVRVGVRKMSAKTVKRG